jgi:hypothetical protein
MSRNEVCACGSGKRYKHCHGKAETTSPPSQLHIEALAAQRAGELRRAEALYRQALHRDPADVESRHMLGVALFERMRYRDALDHLWDAAERTGWADATIRHNLGLDLAKLMTPQANVRQQALVAGYLVRERARKAAAPVAARVSIVLAVTHAARDVARPNASVGAQPYRDFELAVIDDGTTDGTSDAAAQALAMLAIPSRLVRQAHRGAAHAASAGAALAQGDYLAFLGGGDRFAPQRIARMVAEIARTAPLWGFSRAITLDPDVGEPRDAASTHDTLPKHTLFGDEPGSFALLHRDVAEASGNLFIERDLFHRLGGYRDDVPLRGWEFCVRAAQAVEPVGIDEPLYFHRGRDRMRVAGSAVRTSIEKVAREQVAHALDDDSSAANELCPQFVGNRDLLLRAELRAGRGEMIPVRLLRSLAATWRAQPAMPAQRAPGTPKSAPIGRTALVVLGPYRSGTSALARALNLCGAVLPEQLLPAKLGINPTGFWESEAINDVDARLLRHLGADWNRVTFDLPRQGPLVDEFLADARTVLAEEYAGAPFILIKDPRICVLAPLWHRALTNSGYRPAYVVPVRNPLEVARSLQARGDMAVAEGLALWLAYMQRVEAFADSGGATIVHVRYAALLEDWRSVLARIADALDVPLAIGDRAAEVDGFLTAALRNQQAVDDALDMFLAAHVAAATGDAIRATYRRALARCAADATRA